MVRHIYMSLGSKRLIKPQWKSYGNLLSYIFIFLFVLGYLSIKLRPLTADILREETLLAVELKCVISNENSALVNRGRLKKRNEVSAIDVNELWKIKCKMY